MPHFIPDLSYIPKRCAKYELRYIIFLGAILSANKAETTLPDIEVLPKEELEQAARDFCTTHPSCGKVVLQEYKDSQRDTTESNEQYQLLVEADLTEKTRQEQDEWMTVLAHHAATYVYESAEYYGDNITSYVSTLQEMLWVDEVM